MYEGNLLEEKRWTEMLKEWDAWLKEHHLVTAVETAKKIKPNLAIKSVTTHWATVETFKKFQENYPNIKLRGDLDLSADVVIVTYGDGSSYKWKHFVIEEAN